MATKQERARKARTKQIGPKVDLIKNTPKEDVYKSLRKQLDNAKEALKRMEKEHDEKGVARVQKIICNLTTTINR